MKELDSFTVERLEEIIRSRDFYCHEDTVALARIALAAKRAEPDYYIVKLKFNDGWGDETVLDTYETKLDASKSKDDHGGEIIPVYTTPQLDSQVPLGSWIKCSDHRPERGTDVQVYCSDTREQFVAFHLGNGEFQYAQHEDTSIACRPSHWMPLLAAPEKENG